MAFQWDFAVVLRQPQWILQGLVGTVELTLCALVLAFPIGLLVGALRLSPRRSLSVPAAAYVNLLRNAPVMVLLYWVFFALPLLLHLRLGPFQAGVITLTLQCSAFLAEIFRGGILSIERSQWEAARALGMTYRSIMRWVVLPQACRRMVPPFFLEVIDLIKTTSVTATIAYSDLLYEAMRVSSDTFRPIETFTIAGSVYFVVLSAATAGVRRLERILGVSDRDAAP